MKAADRATFVVDPQGIIRAIEVTAEGIGRDASDLLRKVKAAQYVASHPGEVCPAKWKEGEATLAPSLDWSARSKFPLFSRHSCVGVACSPRSLTLVSSRGFSG